MGPKRAKKIIIESSSPTPVPVAAEPAATDGTVVPSSSSPPPEATALDTSTPPPMATDASVMPINLEDLEDETEEENADAEAAVDEKKTNTTVASAPHHQGKQKDLIGGLVATYYAAAPYLPSGTGNHVQHELEVRFGTRAIHQQITKTDYDAVVKMVKSFGFQVQDDAGAAMGQYSLRIQNEFVDARTGRFKVSDNIRVEIYGMDAIQLYCRTNDIQTVIKTMRDAVQFTNKHSAYGANNVRVPNVVMEDFNFIVSYKLEEGVKSNISAFIAENWGQYKKHFRYLNRVTFVHPDFPIKIDMSIVKSSPRVKAAPAPGAPRKQQGYEMHYTTGEAGIFAAPESYEIELEIDTARIGPGTAFDTADKITAAIKQTIKLVLSGLQHTNYPVAYSEQARVVEQYRRVLGFTGNGKYTPFIGPSSITLQLENVMPIDPNSKVPNIRRDFVVTEKADGLRHLLYIGATDTAEAGKMYLINGSMTVIFTGARTNNRALWGSLLDGELILHTKGGEWLNLFAAFDIYYLKGVDVRALPFVQLAGADTGASGDKGAAAAATAYRYHLLKTVVESANMVNVVESMKKINVAPIRLECKRFYANAGGLTKVDSDNAIFTACGHILQQEKDGVFPYMIDGLIFTHATFGVGANAAGKAGELKKGPWDYSFKWKPTTYNTIDFLVSVAKGESGDDMVGVKFEDGQNADQLNDLLQYKTLGLFSRYNEAKDGFINACQKIYDDDFMNEAGAGAAAATAAAAKSKLTQFVPSTPYDADAGVANIPLKMDNVGDMQMYTTEGDIIQDKMVVEFAYDFARDKGWRWVPLRVRYDKPENAYTVANDIWKNMHNPVTVEMITSGQGIPDQVIDADVYYNTGAAKEGYLTKNLKGFHNGVKSIIITAAVGGRKGQTLIDMACGKAGDLQKWMHAGVDFVFGIDLSRDNLENPKNGACVRYIQKRRENRVVPDCLFVQGNSAYNIRSGDAMMGDRAVQIGRAVFGQGEKSESRLGRGVYRQFGRGANGFNVASMQFALHYMFESEATLTAYVRNLAECVALGGYFVATFYDGKTVFNLLRDKSAGEMTSLFEGGRMIWGIVKRYGAAVSEGDTADLQKLPDSVASLGLKIDVFQESINQWIPEYLVNFAYFTRVMEEFGFVLPTLEEAREMGLPNATGMFDALHAQMVALQGATTRGAIFGANEAAAMSASELKISFLNRYCVFKKVRAVDAAKVKITTLGDYRELPEGYVMSTVAAVAPAAKAAPKPRIRRVKKATTEITADADADAEATVPEPSAHPTLEELGETTKGALISAIEGADVETATATEKKKRTPAARKRIVIE